MRRGALAQLAEHWLCKPGVRGSNPLGSTGLIIGMPNLALNRAFAVVDHMDWERARTEQLANPHPLLEARRAAGLCDRRDRGERASAGSPSGF
jgi:hypothetical protein